VNYNGLLVFRGAAVQGAVPRSGPGVVNPARSNAGQFFSNNIGPAPKR